MIEVALAVALQAASGLAETDRGSKLYQECRQVVRLSDGEVMQAKEVDATISCLAYIDGFTDGLLMGASHAVCVGGASLGTLARVYVAYMETSPKMMDVEKAVGLTNALMDNYPCHFAPKKKK